MNDSVLDTVRDGFTLPGPPPPHSDGCGNTALAPIGTSADRCIVPLLPADVTGDAAAENNPG